MYCLILFLLIFFIIYKITKKFNFNLKINKYKNNGGRSLVNIDKKKYINKNIKMLKNFEYLENEEE